MNKVFGICLVALLFTLCIVRAQDGSSDELTKRCPISGQLRCGGKCYDPATNTCVEDTTICALNETQLCNKICFNPDLHQCFDNLVLCGLNETLCGQMCFDNSTMDCMDLNVACGADDVICRRTAKFIESFFTQILQIVNGIWETVKVWDWSYLYNQFLAVFFGQDEKCKAAQCPSGLQCCSDYEFGAQCFDSSNQTCIPLMMETGFKLCPVGNQICDKTCYDTATHECRSMLVVPLEGASSNESGNTSGSEQQPASGSQEGSQDGSSTGSSL